MDKNKQMLEYLADCPQIINKELFFNFIKAEDNFKQFVTIADDKVNQVKFIDGSVQKRYTFTLLDYRSVLYQSLVKNQYELNENVEEMFDVQGIIDWIDEKNQLQEFPDFGEDCIVESIEALTEAPDLNGVDTSLTPALAKYSISIRVEYIDKSNVLWNK